MAYGTTDRLTGGTASASDVTYGAAANACDNNAGTLWATNGVAPQWWKYDFGAAVAWKIGRVTIDCRLYEGNREIKDFTIAGSNNDSSWTNLHTGQCTNDANKQTFDFNNTVAYRYIRITVSTSYRTSGQVACEEFEAFEILPMHKGGIAIGSPMIF